MITRGIGLLFGGRRGPPVERLERFAPAAAPREQTTTTEPVGVDPTRPPPDVAQKRVSFGGSRAVASQVELPVLLRWGEQAARGGDRLAAYRFFVQVLDIDPDHEQAWLWRAATSDRLDETIGCLERVLQINATNPRARRGLAELRQHQRDAEPVGEAGAGAG